MKNKEVKSRLKTMQDKLAKEFQSSEFKDYSIINNYESGSSETVSVKFSVVNNIKIEIICSVDFQFESPKSYFLEPVRGDIVHPTTFEIQYHAFYTWRDHSTVSELAIILKNYFQQVPPDIDPGLRNMFALKTEIIQKIENVFDENLKIQIEKKMKSEKPTKILKFGDLKKMDPNFNEIEIKFKKMVNFAEKLVQEIEGEVYYLDSVKELSIQDLIDYKFRRMNLLDTSKLYNNELKVI